MSRRQQSVVPVNQDHALMGLLVLDGRQPHTRVGQPAQIFHSGLEGCLAFKHDSLVKLFLVILDKELASLGG